MDRAQARKAEHRPGAGILVLIAVAVSTPARTAWCEQRVREVMGETADAALAKSEESPAAGATTERGGGATDVGIVGPVAGPPAVLAEPRPLPDNRNWVPVITLGAASAVWLGVGIGMTVASRNARSEADAQRAAILSQGPGCVHAPSDVASACSTFDERAGRAETVGTGAVVAYTASGALAAGALVYALWPRSSASRNAAGVLPTAWVTQGERGLGVVGVW
ncbi:hypothetical protein WMF27_03525 [Sorangium sp. So ce281]|uniref:hypothetical protein n=1 Tax=unclassified Sorangium TaxID=2621164 RepID=UPI003F5EDA31